MLLIFCVFFLLLELGYRAYQYARYDQPVFAFLADESTNPMGDGGGNSVVLGNALNHFVLNPRKSGHTADHLRFTQAVEGAESTVACFGGSSTYGTSVGAADAYPYQLQEVLNAGTAKARYKVLNAGVPGWSLPHHMARYIFDLRNRDTAITHAVLYLGFNDARMNFSSDALDVGHADRFRVYPEELPLYVNSRFLMWLLPRLEAVTGWAWAPSHLNGFAFDETGTWTEAKPANVRRFERELALFLRLLREDGVEVLVVLQDNNGTFDSEVQERLLNQSREVVARIARAEGTWVVDMKDATGSRAEYFTDVIHMNAEGNRVRAEFLAELISGGRPPR